MVGDNFTLRGGRTSRDLPPERRAARSIYFLPEAWAFAFGGERSRLDCGLFPSSRSFEQAGHMGMPFTYSFVSVQQ